MKPVNYDAIAPSYDRRYAAHDYGGVERCLADFLRGASSIAELGCGTGHWLASAASLPQRPSVVGLDRAAGMLANARRAAPTAALVRGTADVLPWSDASLDRVFCINALHHFPNHSRVFAECARVLRPGGGFMTVAMDPHVGDDRWWVYDYFPEALPADRARFPSTPAIRRQRADCGFQRVETTVAQHMPGRVSFDEAEAQGLLDRGYTSQFQVIGDAEWEAGLARIRRERPDLGADLWLWATAGWVGQ